MCHLSESDLREVRSSVKIRGANEYSIRTALLVNTDFHPMVNRFQFLETVSAVV